MARPASCQEVLQVLLVLCVGAAMLSPIGVYGSYWWVPFAGMAAIVAYRRVMDWAYGRWPW